MNVRGWLPAVFAAALLAGGCRFSGGTTEWPPEAVREIAFQTGYPERIRVLPLALDEEENVATGEEFESAYPYRELAAALRRSPVELLLLPGDGRLFAVLPEEGGISPRFYRAEREAAGFEPEDSAVLVSEQEEGRFVPFFRIWSAPGVYCPRPRPHKAPEWTAENTLEVSLAPEYRIGTERFGERREFEKAIRIHLKSGRWARVVLSGELPEDPALLEAFCRLTDFYGSDLQYGELWRCARCAGTGVER